jgi:8-oxo-dGTP pyrophosphatase MutT (NUDIX family)
MLPEALSEESRHPGIQYVVGAVIIDELGRAYLQQRSGHAHNFPGCWDIVGGHVEDGETLYQALVREIQEETGWQLSRIWRVASSFDWYGTDGIARREIDVVATASGDLANPRLERDKVTRSTWADKHELRTLAEGYSPEERMMIMMCLRVLG